MRKSYESIPYLEPFINMTNEEFVKNYNRLSWFFLRNHKRYATFEIIPEENIPKTIKGMYEKKDVMPALYAGPKTLYEVTTLLTILGGEAVKRIEY